MNDELGHALRSTHRGRTLELPKVRASGTRYFVGYDDAQIEELSQGFDDRVMGPPEVFVVEDAELTPLQALGGGLHSGGVTDGSGYRDDLSLHRGRGPTRRTHVVSPGDAPARGPEVRFETAWFGGYLFDHFGHFLLEGLARIQAAAEDASHQPVVFLSPTPTMPLRGYMVDTLTLAGVDPGRVRLCDRPTAVRELLVQDPAFEIRSHVRPGCYSRLKREASRPRRPSAVLYLSRSGLELQRSALGEPELEDRLRQELQAVVHHPELVPMTAQIETLAEARVIVGCEGSAFHPLMFVGTRPTAVILCDARPNLNYLLCDELWDGDVVYVKASPEGTPAAPNRHAAWPVDVDLAVDIARAADMAAR